MQRECGFTLIEILVALTVLGLLVIALHQGTRTGFALWDAQTRRASETEELDATARTLRTLLTGIPSLPAAADGTQQAIAMTGTPDRVAFVGDLPTGLGTTQQADIAIERRGLRLVLRWTPHRHENANSTAASVETELVRGVEQLDLAYFGAAIPGQTTRWNAQWAGPILPLLIRVRLRFAANDNRRWPDLLAAPQLARP